GPDRRTGKSSSSAHYVPVPAIRQQWRPHVLRRRLPSHVSPRCRLRCPGTYRYQARRSTGGASVEVRACDQPQGGQGDRHRVSDRNSPARRRGDRIACSLLRVLPAANGMARPGSAIYLLSRVGRRKAKLREHAMRTSQNTAETINTIGIDVGKNTFHLVGLDKRGAIVL